MTCIVGFKDKNGVYIGGDSAAVADYKVTIRKDAKVFVNGAFVFGFVDSFRMGQLLRFNLKVPKQKPGKSDYEYMSTVFIDSLRKCLMEGGFLKKESNEETGGKFVVGYKNNIYEVDSDFQVGIPHDDYVAMGVGEDFAFGALSVPYDDKDPVGKVIVALEAAAKYCPGVRPPFNVIKVLKNGKIEYLEGVA